MKTTLNLSKQLLDEAVRLANARTKTQVVTLALEEFIRRRKIERIIGESGSLQFSDEWEKARHAR